jgi:hypothetical protein
MTYSLPGVPDPWKIKIFARERLETPHVSIICRTKRWRFSLRDVGFMDPKPSPAEVPTAVIACIHTHLGLLCEQWDALHGHLNPVRGRSRPPGPGR